MTARPIEPQPGSSIDPEDFVGRRRATDLTLTMVHRGSDILLSDPRRLGKTSWLDYLVARVDDVDVVKIDYEGVDSTELFLLRTAEKLIDFGRLTDKARRALSSLFEAAGAEVSLVGVKIKAGVQVESRLRLLQRTVRSVDVERERPLVIAMDEVPAAVLNIARHEGADAAGALLQCLRSLRSSTTYVRWIVCGSVGFHHVLRHASSTEAALNDLQHLPFGPLDDADADELAERLFAGIKRVAGSDAVAELGAVTGRVPYFMHLVASRLEAQATRGVVSAADVRTAFDTFIGDRDESRAATHLVSRIDTYYGELAKPAKRLLDDAARAGRLEPDDLDAVALEHDDRIRMLDLLCDDHYLVTRQDGSVEWRYDVLRRIWGVRRRVR